MSHMDLQWQKGGKPLATFLPSGLLEYQVDPGPTYDSPPPPEREKTPSSRCRKKKLEVTKVDSAREVVMNRRLLIQQEQQFHRLSRQLVSCVIKHTKKAFLQKKFLLGCKSCRLRSSKP